MLELLNYPTLRLIWWLLLGILLIGYAVMDGFDLGLAILYRWLTRTDQERRVFLETIEPVWEGNQIWLVLGGGAIFAAWPLLYATAFSGFYFAMLLVLLGLIIRPVGLNFRNKVADPRWRATWDWGLLVSGLVPALVFGVAFGNLFQGVPYHFDDTLRVFYTGSFWALLNPFALLVGLVSIFMLCLHGATYAALKVDRQLAPRARRAGYLMAGLFIATFVSAGAWLATGVFPAYQLASVLGPDHPANPLLKEVTVSGSWFANFTAYPWLWLAPLGAVGGALLTALLLRLQRDGLAFITSSLVQAGTILTAGLALFPFFLPSSSHPHHSLTVWDASSSHLTLAIMLVAVIIFLPVVLAYTAWVFRVLKGRVTLAHINHSSDY